MTEKQGTTRRDLKERLIVKAWEDETFKQELLSNPKAVIEKELGIKMPEGVEYQVFEETANRCYMVLPAKPSEGELSDEELESVAGGKSFSGEGYISVGISDPFPTLLIP